eukprot:GFUD01054254.1.p1 GENE.GFUD01054254.1~~GFUD01054254.1.p1  ORF type:complete len:292 (-),score=50.27 GFUD01054254.1:44-919(-)
MMTCITNNGAAKIKTTLEKTGDSHVNDTKDIKADTSELRVDTNELKADTNELKVDTNKLKADTNYIKANTSEIKADANEIKADTKHILELLMNNSCSSSGKKTWTVIQRRGQYGNPPDYFSNKLWADYVNGFGNPSEELWIGLKHIALLTSTGLWELRIDLEDFDGNPYFALYSNFKINFVGPYSLALSGYDAVQSTLKDSLSGHDGASFSSSDNDNDISSANCAATYRGAWWYTACHSSNLNGYNYNRGDLPETGTYYAKGIIWKNENNVLEQDYYFSWPKAEMKIRRHD